LSAPPRAKLIVPSDLAPGIRVHTGGHVVVRDLPVRLAGCVEGSGQAEHVRRMMGFWPDLLLALLPRLESRATIRLSIRQSSSGTRPVPIRAGQSGEGV
jgi:hypothetical protein